DGHADDPKCLTAEPISINQTTLWLVDAGSDERRLLAPEPGDTVAYGTVRFSRDGKGRVLTADQENEFLRLDYLDLATMKVTWLSGDMSWYVKGFALSLDGKRIAF